MEAILLDQVTWLYADEKRSIRSIADDVGWSYWKVRSELLKHGVELRTSFEGRALATKKVEWVEDENGCHTCTSHTRLKRGYHQIVRNGKTYTLHRYVYKEHYGLSDEEMKGFVVMHTCDNPSCVNIDHLRLGTQSDNMQDRLAKGR